MKKEQEIEMEVTAMEIMLLEQLKECSQALSKLTVHGMLTIEEVQTIAGRIRQQLPSLQSL